jgi:hypothetical protein
MTAFVPYLLKVILCSMILLAYYYLALRNKHFHQWNRFYLLIAVLLSICIPLCNFTFLHDTAQEKDRTFRLLEAMSGGDELVAGIAAPSGFLHILSDKAPLLAYSSVSFTLLVLFLSAIWKIIRLIRSHPATSIGKICLITTEAKGTPFSFLNYLFWNPAISLEAPAGRQVFDHEAAHIQEKHSLDKLFMHVVLIFLWINPIFWLIRYELKMIHEFIADQQAVKDRDASGFAAMILQAAYPQQFNSIVHSFFQKPVKRRLLMLTRMQTNRMNYVSRLLAIPVLAFVILAFSVRSREQGRPLNAGDKKIPVVIDANPDGQDIDTAKPVFVKVQQEAQFPGGPAAWRQFLQKELKADVTVNNGAPAGTYTVMIQFLVDADGSISDIRPLTKHGYGTEEEVLRIMQLSPKWTPAVQNGRPVASYRKQPVTFVIAEDNKKETKLKVTQTTKG